MATTSRGGSTAAAGSATGSAPALASPPGAIIRIHHGRATVLDNDSFTGDVLNPRKRFDEYFRRFVLDAFRARVIRVLHER